MEYIVQNHFRHVSKYSVNDIIHIVCVNDISFIQNHLYCLLTRIIYIIRIKTNIIFNRGPQIGEKMLFAVSEIDTYRVCKISKIVRECLQKRRG